MSQKEYERLVKKGRDFMRHLPNIVLDDWQSDQELKKPQPPLCKASVSKEIYPLERNFQDIEIKDDLTSILTRRKSHRVYSAEKMTSKELSYLLWAIQGVKDIRGDNYATLRTVPSAGARHPFETYLIINDVTGLKPGLYHYLPLEHSLAFLDEIKDIPETINEAVCGQAWAKKANVLFIFTCIAYRAEWRYGYLAHKPALIDLGHVGENLYLAATALDLGTCGIATYDDYFINDLLKIDPKEEIVVYLHTLGTVKKEDQDKEQAFYAFLKEQQ